MNNGDVSLKEVDRVEVLTLIDNYVDVLLKGTDIVTRPHLAKDEEISTDTLLAEHGLSLLVTVYQGTKQHTILFDTGYTPIGVPRNMAKLGVDIAKIEAIVLSHGHMDHTGSLNNLLDKMSTRVPLVVHPDAFLSPRYMELDDGKRLLFPQSPTRDELSQRNVEVLERRTPTLLVDDLVLVSGEVERTTEFEKGLPNALVEKQVSDLEKFLHFGTCYPK